MSPCSVLSLDDRYIAISLEWPWLRIIFLRSSLLSSITSWLTLLFPWRYVSQLASLENAWEIGFLENFLPHDGTLSLTWFFIFFLLLELSNQFRRIQIICDPFFSFSREWYAINLCYGYCKIGFLLGTSIWMYLHQ